MHSLVTIHKRSTWVLGQFNFISNFLYSDLACYLDYGIASGPGPLVLFSLYIFSFFSLDPCRGHRVYVQAKGSSVEHPEAN